MTLFTKLLTFTKPVSGGTPQNQVSASLGFTPKGAIAFHANYHTSSSSTSFTADCGLGMGFSDGTTHRCRCLSSNDGTAESQVGMAEQDSFIARCTVTGGTINDEADVSFQSDTITLTWTTLSTTAGFIFVFVFGGTDITNVKVGDFAVPAGTTGNHTTSGTDFTPDCELYLVCEDDNNNTSLDAASWGIGAAISSSKRWAVAGSIEDAQATSDTWKGQCSTVCYYKISSATGSTSGLNDFVAFTSTGRTWNQSQASGLARKVYFMAIKGALFDLGTFAVTAGNGNFTPVTGMAFQPKAVLFTASGGFTDSTVSTGQFRSSIGCAISSTEQGCVSVHDKDAELIMTSAKIHSLTDCVRLHTAESTVSSSVSELEMDLVSMDADGFTLNRSVNTTFLSNELVMWFAMGPSTSNAITVSLSDTVNQSDSIARVKGAVDAGSDTVSITAGGLANPLRNKIRPLSELVQSTDQVVRRKTRTVPTSTDTVTISDSSAMVKAKNVSKTIASEVIQVGVGTVATMKAKIRTASDSLTTSGTLTRLIAKLRSIATQTTVNITDSVARTVTTGGSEDIARSVNEAILTVGVVIGRMAAKWRRI